MIGVYGLTVCDRVRREELVGESDVESEDSNGEDEAIRARLEAQMAQSLGLADITVDRAPPVSASKPPSGAAREASREASSDDDMDDAASDDQSDGGEGDGREEYEFNLFGGVTGAPTKVVLEDDSKPRGDGALESRHPRAFYLAEKLSDEERRKLLFAAVSGEQVLERSRQRWWGMEYPWRVTHITTVTKTAPDGTTQTKAAPDEDEARKMKRRPGKKTRIAQRMRERKKKEKAEQAERKAREKKEEAEKKAKEKEEQVKDKKARMNRLKKLRKRAKNREQKAVAKSAEEGGGNEGEDSEGGSSSE